ncbi:hypothetical protein FQA39_LY00747 [Lamprigera yunnana]|nr:hypothetical protein FQA39_LY00747 [Lamprigera yunnana]
MNELNSKLKVPDTNVYEILAEIEVEANIRAFVTKQIVATGLTKDQLTISSNSRIQRKTRNRSIDKIETTKRLIQPIQPICSKSNSLMSQCIIEDVTSNRNIELSFDEKVSGNNIAEFNALQTTDNMTKMDFNRVSEKAEFLNCVPSFYNNVNLLEANKEQ